MAKTKSLNEATSRQAAIDEGYTLWDAIAKFCPSWQEETTQVKIRGNVSKGTRFKVEGGMSGVWNELAALAWADQIWWFARRTPIAPRERMPGRALTYYKISDAFDETLQGPGGPDDLLYDVCFLDRRGNPEDNRGAIGRTFLEEIRQELRSWASTRMDQRRRAPGNTVENVQEEAKIEFRDRLAVKDIEGTVSEVAKGRNDGWEKSGKAPEKTDSPA